ncbi:MAG: IPT/TIG domain-containing protein [Acidobacteriota bacterium]|nr:IPT/TIG domain-containing protein [Acidobacteriota bacterium]
MRFRLFVLTVLVALTASLFADDYAILPSSGPTSGGTQVTIKGDFGSWPYGVIFGSVGVPAVRVDEHTLTATTPAHLPGTVPVSIFEYDIGLATDLSFTFYETATPRYERVLLPIFTPPIKGAFGSEFHTDLRASLKDGGTIVHLYGLEPACVAPPCVFDAEREAYTLTREAPDLEPSSVERSPTPGRFLYIPAEEASHVSMNLRAYDVTRSHENFGTEMPVVRMREFAANYSVIKLVGVPRDPRFRSTLRIYGAGSTFVKVRIEAEGSVTERMVVLSEPADLFTPAYAQISDLPSGTGTMKISIFVPMPPVLPVASEPIWAFVTVTNNDTQLISTITP